MAALIVCPACDLAHHSSPLSGAARARCSRCKAPIQWAENGRIDSAIAVAVCGVMLFVLANAYPLVEMNANGSTRVATLTGAAVSMYHQGYASLAALVFLTTVIGPLAQITGVLYLLLPLRHARRAPGQNVVFRMLSHVRSWTFVEVFMLGALVALVRLSAFARVMPGVALWSCALLMVALAALTHMTSPGQFWRWVERSQA